MSNDLKNQIDAAERKITSMATKIERAETKLEDARDIGDIEFWRKRLSDLQDKENKLQDEKNKLLDKENKLLDLKIKQTVSSEERAALLRKQILKEENRQSKSLLYLCTKAWRCDHSNPIALTDIIYRCLRCHSNVHKS